MTTSTSWPLRWLTLGYMAMMVLNTAWADDCPAPFTFTKTETTTVWADGSWPTKTVTQLVVPDDCPLEPRYSCYVVHTITLNAQIPQATIQMMLPQHESKQAWKAASKDKEDEESNNAIEERQNGADAAGQMVADVGCAIVTSTELVMTVVTAVPEVDITYTYSYSIGPGNSGDHKHRKYSHKSTPTPTSATAATPLPTPPPNTLFPPREQKDVDTPTKTEFKTSFSTHYSYTLSFDFTYGTLMPSPVPGTSLPELPAPTSMPMLTTTTTTTSGSNDATETPSTSTNPSTSPPPTNPTDPSHPPAIPPASFDPVVPAIQETRSEDPSAIGPSVPSTLDESGTGPVTIEQPVPVSIKEEVDPELPDEIGAAPVTIEQPRPESLTSIVLDPPSPTAGLKKACQECAEPCLVDLDVAAKAEVPLLAKLFEDKIKKALASLKLTLENESGSNSAQGKNRDNNNDGSDNGSVHTGLFAGLNVDDHTAGLFHKTCEDKLDAIEKKHVEALNDKCERVIRTGCETGACLQSEIDKAVKLLDVMISTELARDCSQLRSAIIQEFKTRCDQDQDQKAKVSVDAKVDIDKRGLLSGLLGEDNVVDKVVDGLGQTINKVVSKTVTPLMGTNLVEHLVEELTDTVKSVVDSFVGNCNRKGLLDFDTEKDVGAVAAIADVSLNLFKTVCVHIHADAEADTNTQ
ncbi:hypothetical protein BGZ95_001079 [Linnemannia exigua]|uniref:Uncharacterized protein n=1 Tax=Linnemannia exigua TaxID=604196 RepID=A0AAD4DJD6_9FUNG|nr:hypothetical protein BGZ95_001079 [Linnemannia exigua]